MMLLGFKAAGHTSLGWRGAIWKADSWSRGTLMKLISAGLGSTPSLQPLAGRLDHCDLRRERQEIL